MQFFMANQKVLPLHISDDFQFRTEDFLIPSHYSDTIEYVLIPRGLITDRVEKMAWDIVNDHIGQTIHLVCVLKGGCLFFHDLINHIRQIHTHSRSSVIPFTIDFIRLHFLDSYALANSF